MASNGTRRIETIDAAGRPQFSLWRPTDRPRRWEACQWSVAKDAPCVSCQYNRCGLPFVGLCPECGVPRHRTVRLRIGPAAQQTVAAAVVARRKRALVQRAAAAVGYPAETFAFVRSVLHYSTYTLRTLGQRGDPGAVDLSGGLAEYARSHFGGTDEAIMGLAQLRLLRSEHLGLALFTMSTHGVFEASEGDRPEQFSGLFTLSSLFDGW